MATGLGEGEGSPVPGLPRAHSSLSPWSPLGGRGRWGTQGGGLNASSALWLSPSPIRRLNGMVCSSQRPLFSACQLPGYPGEGPAEGGEQAGRWALGTRRPLSPPASLGLSPSRLLPQLPRKVLSLRRRRNGGKAFSKVREITGQEAEDGGTAKAVLLSMVGPWVPSRQWLSPHPIHPHPTHTPTPHLPQPTTHLTYTHTPHISHTSHTAHTRHIHPPHTPSTPHPPQTPSPIYPPSPHLHIDMIREQSWQVSHPHTYNHPSTTPPHTRSSPNLPSSQKPELPWQQAASLGA